MSNCELDISGSGLGAVVGFDEHNNEPSCSTQDREFIQVQIKERASRAAAQGASL